MACWMNSIDQIQMPKYEVEKFNLLSMLLGFDGPNPRFKIWHIYFQCFLNLIVQIKMLKYDIQSSGETWEPEEKQTILDQVKHWADHFTLHWSCDADAGSLVCLCKIHL